MCQNYLDAQMQKTLLITALFISARANGQCPSSISLSGQGNDGLGPMLTVAPPTGSNFARIIWYNGNTAVDTVLAADKKGMIVAGGNGAGAAANQQQDVWGIYVDANGNLYVSDVGNKWLMILELMLVLLKLTYRCKIHL